MPSSLFSMFGGNSAPSTGINQNFLNALMQFKNQMAPIMNAQNPAQAVQNLLAQRGVSPEQFQQIVSQYSAQATEIQKQLMGR